MARRKDSPQKAAMREMMRDYLKNNDISIKDGTDVNSIMRDMMSVLLEGALDEELDEEDKLEEIIKGVFELRDFLEIVNKKYDENNEMLDVLEVTDTDEFSDKLDVIYSYVTSIKEEVAKLFEIANSYSKSFDI